MELLPQLTMKENGEEGKQNEKEEEGGFEKVWGGGNCLLIIPCTHMTARVFGVKRSEIRVF